MKNSFDDRQLELAAKNIVAGIAQESYIAPAENNNDNTVSIKLAKAKAGARRSINRTVRICAVAAVLMVGLVCALFMGAENDEAPMEIYLEKQAYMWKNNDPDDSQNMPVVVTIDLKEREVIYNGKNLSDGTSISSSKYENEERMGIILNGDIKLKDLDGKIVYEFLDIEFVKMDNALDIEHKEHDIKLDTATDKANIKFLWSVEILFNEDYSEFDMMINLGENIEENEIVWLGEDGIFVNSGASSREEAVDKTIEWLESRKLDQQIAKIK